MAEYLAEADQALTREDRDGGTQIGDVADAPGAVVGIVPEENVAGKDILDAEPLEDRVDHRRIRPAGQLAPARVEERHPVVVLIPDHRRAGSSFDCGLDLHFGRPDGALDDLVVDRA